MGGSQSYENQSSPYDYNDDSNGENMQEAQTMTRREHVPPTPPPPLTPEEQLREVRTQVDSFVGMFNQLLADIAALQQRQQRTIEEESVAETVTAEILDQRKVQFEFRRIDELLTQSLLRLDAVDCTSDPQLRQQRKEIINHIEQVLARVDEARRTVVV